MLSASKENFINGAFIYFTKIWCLLRIYSVTITLFTIKMHIPFTMTHTPEAQDLLHFERWGGIIGYCIGGMI